jgi:hypothetical protein
MIEVLQIIAGSWPIALMVVVTIAGIVLNNRWKQAMDDSQAVKDLRASQALVVKDRYTDE